MDDAAWRPEQGPEAVPLASLDEGQVEIALDAFVEVLVGPDGHPRARKM